MLNGRGYAWSRSHRIHRRHTTTTMTLSTQVMRRSLCSSTTLPSTQTFVVQITRSRQVGYTTPQAGSFCVQLRMQAAVTALTELQSGRSNAHYDKIVMLSAMTMTMTIAMIIRLLLTATTMIRMLMMVAMMLFVVMMLMKAKWL